MSKRSELDVVVAALRRIGASFEKESYELYGSDGTRLVIEEGYGGLFTQMNFDAGGQLTAIGAYE